MYIIIEFGMTMIYPGRYNMTVSKFSVSVRKGGFYCPDSVSSLYYKGSASLNGTINLGVCA